MVKSLVFNQQPSKKQPFQSAANQISSQLQYLLKRHFQKLLSQKKTFWKIYLSKLIPQNAQFENFSLKKYIFRIAALIKKYQEHITIFAFNLFFIIAAKKIICHWYNTNYFSVYVHSFIKHLQIMFFFFFKSRINCDYSYTSMIKTYLGYFFVVKTYSFITVRFFFGLQKFFNKTRFFNASADVIPNSFAFFQ